MKKIRLLALAVVVSSALVFASAPAGASSFSTDSWGCGWSGASVAGPYSWTDSASWCALSSGVQVDYYTGGSWHTYSWLWGGNYVEKWATGSLDSQHQIYVPGVGQGYGQIEYSSY